MSSALSGWNSSRSKPGNRLILILREGHAERIPVRFQVNLANGHEELLRREPSAGIHDDVAGPPRNGVHDETIDSAEFFPLVVPDFHVIEIERLVIE